MTDYNKFHGFDESKIKFNEEEIIIDNNTKYVITYKKNDDGLIAKHTKIYRLEKQTNYVNKNVNERLGWTKFGVSKGLPPGPDSSSTNVVADEVFFEFTNNKLSDDKEDTSSLFSSTKNAVKCKYCGGNHWSIKCNNKEINTTNLKNENNLQNTNLQNKYVPKFKKNGLVSENRNKNTLKISNITENATEQDIRDLFINYGRITKIYYNNKGYAYLTYAELHSCEKSIECVNGHPYDYLILKVEMADK